MFLFVFEKRGMGVDTREIVYFDLPPNGERVDEPISLYNGFDQAS